MAYVEKRGKMSYRITVSDGFNENGTRVRKSTIFKPKHGLTEKQALKAAKEFAVKFENTCKGVSNFDDSMTFAELSDWYFDTVAPFKLRAMTLEQARDMVNVWILPKLGDKRLRDLRPAVFDAFLRQLALTGKKDGTPLSANSVNKARTRLYTIFAAAVKAEIIPSNPLERVDSFKKEDKLPTFLTKEQAQVFKERLTVIDDIGLRGLLWTGLLTGARSGELRALTWNDINLKTGLININKSADRRNRITAPKSKKSYRVINASFLLPFFHQYRRAIEDYAESLGTAWVDNNLVFPNPIGEVIQISAPAHAMKKIINGTDIPPEFHPHSLRHTFASVSISTGADVKTVQEILGHSSAATTLNIYSHSFAEERAKTMKATGAAIVGGDVDTLLPFSGAEGPVLKNGVNLGAQERKRDEIGRKAVKRRPQKTPKSAQKTHFPKNNETT
jgi:integrase